MRKILKLHLAYCAAAVLVCAPARAQTPAQPSQPAGPPAAPGPQITNPNEIAYPHASAAPPLEITPATPETPNLWSNYETHFSIEFGGRTVNTTGNEDVYRTFVNLQSGVRLLDQSLDMHSTNQKGFFDDLNESSFGIGGDPNEAVRLRATKHRWYNFDGSWRRDLNFWDYNLLANPLNPAGPIGASQINVSPALLDLSRKMLDVNLTLLPDSAIQFVLGYSHYLNDGFSYNTVHEGTDTQLAQPWHDASDAYHLGVSWHPVQRTRITYDQFYTRNKNETNDFLNVFPYSLSNGTPTNLGIVFAGSTPCSAPFTGAFVTPNCNLFTGYSNASSYYTDIPTEQLGFESTYWRRLHITGRGSYTGASTHMPYSNETFNGFDTPTTKQAVLTGPAKIQQITTSTDAGITYDVTEKMSISDQFRWYAYRIPGGASLLQTFLYGTDALVTANTFPSPGCPPPYTSAGCPQHTTSSGPDEETTGYSTFQSQNQKRNTFEVHYDFMQHLSGYIGYEFERQFIVIDGSNTSLSSYFPTFPNRGGCTATPINGVCQSTSSTFSTAGVDITTNGGVAGIAAEPIHNLRFNADAEVSYSDNVFTNIQPRHLQLYRGKAIYTPKTWLDIHAMTRLEDMRNLAAGLGNNGHNRSVSVGSVLSISPRFGIDLNYSYDDMATDIYICFNASPTPPFASTTSLCPAGYLTTLSYYRNHDHFASGNFLIKPFARTTLTAGYTITSTNGTNLLINPLAPAAPVAINYHLPDAVVTIDLVKHLAFKAGWNLYDYDEKTPPGVLIAPRNFESNNLTFSLRYSM